MTLVSMVVPEGSEPGQVLEFQVPASVLNPSPGVPAEEESYLRDYAPGGLEAMPAKGAAPEAAEP